MSSPQPSPYKDRLVRYYTKYNPEKLSSVDTALAKYKGNEKAMFEALVAKYGPEPPATEALGTGPNAAALIGANPHKARLIRFYQKYNPDKVGSVDAALKTYAGKEEQMFKALVAKYGPEPPANETASAEPVATKPVADGAASSAPNPHKARLTRFYQKYNPDKVGSVDAALKTYAGKEEQMFKALVAKYGPEPEDRTATETREVAHESYRERLIRFYAEYAPDRVQNVDETLEKYQGKEVAMFKALVAKYGPEPSGPLDERVAAIRAEVLKLYETYAPNKIHNLDVALAMYKGREEELRDAVKAKYLGAAAATPPPEEAPPTTKEETEEDKATAAYRERLTRFYETYAPDKVPMVDATLEKYKGKEEAMFRALNQKYSVADSPAPEAEASPAKGGLPDPVPDEDDEEYRNNPFRERLVAYYKEHAPDLVGSARVQLQAYKGREEELFARLDQEYKTLADQAPVFSLTEWARSVEGTDYNALIDYYGGETHATFACAVALLIHSVTPAKVFDARTTGMLDFPAGDAFPSGAIDAVGPTLTYVFQCLNEVRDVYLHAHKRMQTLIAEESNAWGMIDYNHQQACGGGQYRLDVAARALALIHEVEAEKRDKLRTDEKLRWAGALEWFRTRRDKLLLDQDPPGMSKLNLRWEMYKNSVTGAAQRSDSVQRQQQRDSGVSHTPKYGGVACSPSSSRPSHHASQGDSPVPMAPSYGGHTLRRKDPVPKFSQRSASSQRTQQPSAPVAAVEHSPWRPAGQAPVYRSTSPRPSTSPVPSGYGRRSVSPCAKPLETLGRSPQVLRASGGRAAFSHMIRGVSPEVFGLPAGRSRSPVL